MADREVGNLWHIRRGEHEAGLILQASCIRGSENPSHQGSQPSATSVKPVVKR